ncbi:MAG: radical SAM protein [Deltaproteobacteria bacterium]|nr:radical SAM protein [Deltaproteobacteria bacterium]
MARKKMFIAPFYVNHRGCPERCVFCDQNSISGQDGGMAEGDEIKSEISSYLESWQGEGRREVAFYGGTFTALPLAMQEHMLGQVKPFIDNGEIDAVRVSTRPDAIDEEGLKLLKKYGAATVELGVQSMDDEVLRSSGRGHSSADTESAARLIREYGFTLGCQLMPGLPGDSYERSMKSAFKVADLGAELVRIYPALVIRGTELEKKFQEGSYRPLTMEEALPLCADMVELFRARNIDVIRIGLQAEESLEKSLLSGPYHPSFGEMVESAIFMKKARSLLAKASYGNKDISFSISPSDESAFRGQRNMNIKRLSADFPRLNFSIRKDFSLKRGKVLIH